MSELIWPEVFTNPDFEYDADDKDHVVKALADGIEGWACCVCGVRPESFGIGMVKISRFAKCGPSAKDLSAKARELGFLDHEHRE